MKIVRVPVGGIPYTEEIEPSVELFQGLVEGPFDYAMVNAVTAMVFNADQWTQPYNFTINGRKIKGPVFFIGVGRREWKDCDINTDRISEMIKEKE